MHPVPGRFSRTRHEATFFVSVARVSPPNANDP
jgi:hypothetical protein